MCERVALSLLTSLSLSLFFTVSSLPPLLSRSRTRIDRFASQIAFITYACIHSIKHEIGRISGINKMRNARQCHRLGSLHGAVERGDDEIFYSSAENTSRRKCNEGELQANSSAPKKARAHTHYSHSEYLLFIQLQFRFCSFERCVLVVSVVLLVGCQSGCQTNGSLMKWVQNKRRHKCVCSGKGMSSYLHRWNDVCVAHSAYRCCCRDGHASRRIIERIQKDFEFILRLLKRIRLCFAFCASREAGMGELLRRLFIQASIDRMFGSFHENRYLLRVKMHIYGQN